MLKRYRKGSVRVAAGPAPTPALAYAVERTGANVVTVRMDVRAGWTQDFLLSFDRHHDNPDTDQAMERRHLGEALERGAGILDGGDLHCAMQGKYDKRSDKAKLRPEHQSGDYLDKLVSTAAAFYAPYARNWILMGMGNHETGILKNHETNLTERTAERINTTTGAHVIAGGHTNWVRFMFNTYGARRESRVLFMHHGYGGGGPVTRGVIQSNRMAVYLPDADIVASGHTHDEWQVPISRARISDQGVLYQDEQIHLRVPSYKDEYREGRGGWHIERGGPPKTTGAMWLRFAHEGGGRIVTQIQRAK
jgi:hypothetical protein